jgi:hypothetical protein
MLRKRIARLYGIHPREVDALDFQEVADVLALRQLQQDLTNG